MAIVREGWWRGCGRCPPPCPRGNVYFLPTGIVSRLYLTHAMVEHGCTGDDSCGVKGGVAEASRCGTIVHMASAYARDAKQLREFAAGPANVLHGTTPVAAASLCEVGQQMQALSAEQPQQLRAAQ